MNYLPLFLALLCADVLAYDSFGFIESTINFCPSSMNKDKCKTAAEEHWSAGGRRIFRAESENIDYKPAGCSYDKRLDKLVEEKSTTTNCGYALGGCASTPTYTDDEKYEGVIWNTNKGSTHKNFVRLCRVTMCDPGTLPIEKTVTSKVRFFYDDQKKQHQKCGEGYIPMTSMENCYLAYKGYLATPPKDEYGYEIEFTWGGWLRDRDYPKGCSLVLGGTFVWNMHPNAEQKPTHNGERGIVCQPVNLQYPNFGCVDKDFPNINTDTSITPKIYNPLKQSQTPTIAQEATPNLLPVVVVLSVLCLFLMVVVVVCIYKRGKDLEMRKNINATVANNDDATVVL